MASRLTRPELSRRAWGFTLVELIVTLIIIALIAAVSGPVFFNIGTFRESGFYDEMVSAIRYAQKYAVASHCNVRVVIASSGYSLARPVNAAACNTGPNNYATPMTDPSGNAANFARAVPSGITIAPPAGDIVFSADGSASLVSGSTTVPITAPVSIGVGSRTILVHGETGFVQ